MISLIGFSTTISIPWGGVNSTGWEKPRFMTSFLPCSWALQPTPTISIVFWNPSVTPVTMLAIRARVIPCQAQVCFSSFDRDTTTLSSETSTAIPGINGVFSSPFVPFTTTLSPLIVTLVPLGRTIALRPMRDIRKSPPYQT